MQAMIAAGFRLEEYAVMRYLMDNVGASNVKLLIADENMLHTPLDAALASPEIDWESPRPEDGIQGGGWGSTRACIFSGLSVAQQVCFLVLPCSQWFSDAVSRCCPPPFRGP